jgi:hypothetical protein
VILVGNIMDVEMDRIYASSCGFCQPLFLGLFFFLQLAGSWTLYNFLPNLLLLS